MPNPEFLNHKYRIIIIITKFNISYHLRFADFFTRFYAYNHSIIDEYYSKNHSKKMNAIIEFTNTFMKVSIEYIRWKLYSMLQKTVSLYPNGLREFCSNRDPNEPKSN